MSLFVLIKVTVCLAMLISDYKSAALQIKEKKNLCGTSSSISNISKH